MARSEKWRYLLEKKMGSNMEQMNLWIISRLVQQFSSGLRSLVQTCPFVPFHRENSVCTRHELNELFVVATMT